jgi:hypothetical protein
MALRTGCGCEKERAMMILVMVATVFLGVVVDDGVPF